jgi:hypothetical protein
MLQLQLILEHACFSFGQREMQETLDKWDHSCAEAISLQTWIEFFQNNKTFETEGNAKSLPNLLSSVGRIQNIIILRLNLNFFEANQFLLNADKVPINYTETHRLIDWCITHTLTSINLNPRRDQLPYIGDPG